MGAQITILKGNASIPPSTAVTQRSLPTCSLANYVLPPLHCELLFVYIVCCRRTGQCFSVLRTRN